MPFALAHDVGNARHMLRISVVEGDGRGLTLYLEGRVMGPWVAELRRACERALAQGRGLTLDVAGVSFLDRDGVGLLRGLMHRQVAVTRCSPFVAEQLREAQPC